ncbi:hypothetical protein D3C71_2007860 [compost metagenome]
MLRQIGRAAYRENLFVEQRRDFHVFWRRAAVIQRQVTVQPGKVADLIRRDNAQVNLFILALELRYKRQQPQ